ncbi:MAG: putative Phytochrome, two-component sensor histidine kinase [Verrucomicrobiales bacterium]|nr:putative Phytochrome, two-component sensor histidine kinase [Verrucomicrobiales bacterium]
MAFQDKPIKQKLVRSILLTSLPVLIIACAVLMTFEVISYRKTAEKNLSTLADIIAANATTSLMYDDPRVANEILSGLKAEPEIEAACLYKADGHLYAIYPTNLPPRSFPNRPEPAGVKFHKQNLVVVQPAIEGGKVVGTLYVRQDLRGLWNRLFIYGSVVLTVIVGAGAIAVFLSGVFQRLISEPILQLAGTAQTISEQKDFSVRAVKTSNDEIGLLTEAFNEMLGEIQASSLALHQAQRELKEHAHDLEKRVEERTARLSEMVGELEAFSYSISHDMRAPLRAMQGYAAYLIENDSSVLPPESQQYLKKIVRASNRLDNLIQDILTYSRVSKDKITLVSVNLDDLMENIIQEYPSFQEPGANIVLRKPLQRVLAHEASLTQVLSNLVGNAVKFVPPGQKPAVTIWSEPRGSFIRLWVKDNGLGIAPKDQKRIFGIFERIHHSKDYDGTGIGLSIVRKAVEKMGGTVGLESELGKGSRFWVELSSG